MCAIDYISTTGFSSLVKRLYPKAEVMQIRTLCRYLDRKKKGLISFSALMDYIGNYSTLSKFPDVDQMCTQIAQSLNDKKQTMKDFIDKLAIDPNSEISVKTFVEKVAEPLGFRGKDAYFLYYGLKDPNESRIVVELVITKIEDKRTELAEAHDKSAGEIKSNVGGEPDISQDEEKEVVIDSKEMSKELAMGVIEFYDVAFGEHSKYKMSEKAIFKLFDTDASGYLTRTEFVAGLRKLRLKMTDQHIDEFLKMADRNESNTISLAEFLETIKLARARITTARMQTLAAKHNMDPEAMYNIALEKVKKFAENKKSDIVNFEYKFQLLDDANEGVLQKTMFEQALREQNIGLSDEEIKYLPFVMRKLR